MRVEKGVRMEGKGTRRRSRREGTPCKLLWELRKDLVDLDPSGKPCEEGAKPVLGRGEKNAGEIV